MRHIYGWGFVCTFMCPSVCLDLCMPVCMPVSPLLHSYVCCYIWTSLRWFIHLYLCYCYPSSLSDCSKMLTGYLGILLLLPLLQVGHFTCLYVPTYHTQLICCHFYLQSGTFGGLSSLGGIVSLFIS